MFTLPALCLLLAMAATLYCALQQKRIYDRILAANVFGTLTILFICVYGFLSGRPDFLDIALVYAMINFITTIAALKFFAFRDQDQTRRIRNEGEI